jgi:hypothetical protein
MLILLAFPSSLLHALPLCSARCCFVFAESLDPPLLAQKLRSPLSSFPFLVSSYETLLLCKPLQLARCSSQFVRPSISLSSHSNTTSATLEACSPPRHHSFIGAPGQTCSLQPALVSTLTRCRSPPKTWNPHRRSAPTPGTQGQAELSLVLSSQCRRATPEVPPPPCCDPEPLPTGRLRSRVCDLPNCHYQQCDLLPRAG